MSSRPFEAHLRELGFSDKEARVYLASLELGPAPIQKIAEKSGVKRATTYVMAESLMDRGLMSTFDKGKKTYFSAESPERLSKFFDEEIAASENRKKIYDDILPGLLALNVVAGNRPRVQFYEGFEGLRAIHADVLATTDKELENIVALDDAKMMNIGDEHVADLRDKLERKGVRVRILYSSKKDKLEYPKNLRWQVKRMSSEIFPMHGELTLYGDKVAAFSYRGKIFGTIIESKEITQTIRVLFELAWKSSDIKTEA